MTQPGDLPTPEPGSPDPSSAAPATPGGGSDWYEPWKPDSAGTSPAAEPPVSGAPPASGAPWGAPAAPGASSPTGPFGAPANGAPPPGPDPYGQPPYDQPPYGQGPYGPGQFGPGMFGPFMGYRGWRRGMYGPMGGMPAGPYLRRRAITHTVMGVILLLIGIGVTAGTFSAASNGSGGVYFVPWGLAVIGVLWIIRGLTMFGRSSRRR